MVCMGRGEWELAFRAAEAEPPLGVGLLVTRACILRGPPDLASLRALFTTEGAQVVGGQYPLRRCVRP